MKISSLIIIIAAFLLYAGSASAQTKDHPGKKVFEDSKCQTCHSIETHNITTKSKKGVDLSNVGAVYRANFLEQFLNKKEKINDKTHPQAFKGSQEDLNKLAEFLQTLNTGEGSKDKKTDTKTDTKSDKSSKDTTGAKK